MHQRLFTALRRFGAAKVGNVAVLTAVVAPVLLGAAGLALDLLRWGNQRSNLQDMADTLALRGAREFLLANSSSSQIEAFIETLAAQSLAATFDVQQYDLVVSADANEASVTINLTEPRDEASLLRFLSSEDVGLTATATAVANGGANVCVIALDPSDRDTVSALSNAKLMAPNCMIQSNSTSKAGVSASGASLLSANIICSSGGENGAAHNFDPQPVTDCPPISDPLEGRTSPAYGGCDFNDAAYGDNGRETNATASLSSVYELLGRSPLITHTKYTLKPGVYCGGLTVFSDADVTLEPGIYIMKDGALDVRRGAVMSGEHVGVYMTGDESVFRFEPDSKISLTAPTRGILAGILFFEDRYAPLDRVHAILSDDARKLLGTFYLPRGVLFVASSRSIADQSAYTAIVARKLHLVGSPTLVLNTDYTLTDVPVPEGVGPTGGSIHLRQ